jgi:glutamate decarboxylase
VHAAAVSNEQEHSMPLHAMTRPGDPGIDDVYATGSADRCLPKYWLPEHRSPAQAVYNLVHDELSLDGNSRQNLATFCTTWAEPEAHRLMDLSLDKNMIDKDEYPQTAEIESRCVHMIADLWHAPGARSTVGCSITGSSEACMLDGLALKWQWRKRRIAADKSHGKPNIVCGPVQVCWEKFARYFDVEIR